MKAETRHDRLARGYTEDAAGCWIWRGRLLSGGYGDLKYRGQRIAAHRFAYETAIGSIPEGMVLDHLCRNRACVNPTHLEPVTFRENVLRGEGPTARNARATHCPKGHAYAGDNLTVSNGSRFCRTCNRDAVRRLKHRKKASPL